MSDGSVRRVERTSAAGESDRAGLGSFRDERNERKGAAAGRAGDTGRSDARIVAELQATRARRVLRVRMRVLRVCVLRVRLTCRIGQASKRCTGHQIGLSRRVPSARSATPRPRSPRACRTGREDGRRRPCAPRGRRQRGRRPCRKWRSRRRGRHTCAHRGGPTCRVRSWLQCEGGRAVEQPARAAWSSTLARMSGRGAAAAATSAGGQSILPTLILPTLKR